MTVHLPRRRAAAVEVDVEPGPDHTAGDLAGALAELLDEPVGHLTVSGRVVPPETTVGLPPLLQGCSLVVDGPPAQPALQADRAAIDLVVTGGPDSGHAAPLTGSELVVGRSPTSGLAVDDPRLSRRHARLSVSADRVRVDDLASLNGVRVDDEPVAEQGALLDLASVVRLGGTEMRLRRPALALARVRTPGDGTATVQRAPRVARPRPAVRVVAPQRPDAPHRSRMPWIAALVPLPFALVFAWLWGPQLLAFALLGPVVMMGTAVGDRVGGRRRHRAATAAHDETLRAREAELSAALQHEARERHERAPDPAEVLAIALGPSSRIWERRRRDPDFGDIRVGLGTVPARAVWQPPDVGAADVHPPLPHAPVVVSLAGTGGLGVTGAPGRRDAVLRCVLGQLAALHSPADLSVWTLGDGESDWAWLRRLPHANATAAGHRVRAAAGVVDELEAMVVRRSKESPPHDGWDGPVDVVVVPDNSRASLRLDTLCGAGPSVGVWVLTAAATREALPSGCRAVLDIGADGAADIDVDAGSAADLVATGSAPATDVLVDGVGSWWAERLSRALSPLRDPAAREHGGLPDRVRLLDLLDLDPADTDAVDQRWAEGGGAARAVVGSCRTGSWQIDLTTDGPHVLVGGTTGAGKSEMLQTLVASLALSCPSSRLGFVLVDYKGGSAFGPCADLPHTLGTVTDLDEHLAERALVSLAAEVRRRERILAEHGAKDLDAYLDLPSVAPAGRPELARLVIVIDEFRVLAEEVPDFLDGVVRLAAVGRSLGIHLVLATQRPAGAVTADIAANVNLRVALRVRDQADSHDVIDAPDAARIPTLLPGRGFARGGSGDLLAFQVASVSGTAPSRASRLLVRPAADTATRRDEAAGRGNAGRDAAVVADDGPTDLDRIVAAVVKAQARRSQPPPHRPWQPPLPVDLKVSQVPSASGIPVGVVDLPGEQRTEALEWDVDRGHWLLAGGPRSGRTTALLTLIEGACRRWGPRDLHVYAVDSSGALGTLAALPQVGAVVRPDQSTRLRRMVDRLADEVRDRTRTLSALPVEDLRQWRTGAGASPSGLPDPPAAVLVAVDGWDRLAATTDPIDHGSLTDALVALARSGPSVGLGMVVTGDRSVLLGRLAPLASATFVLPLADPMDLALAGLGRRDIPRVWPPGRAVRVPERTEVQFARAEPTAATQKAGLAVNPATGHPAREGPKSAESDLDGARPLPWVLRELPDVVRLDELARSAGEHPAGGLPPWCLGVGGDAALPIGLQPEQAGRRVLIAGPARSGRSTTLSVLAQGAVQAGRVVVRLDLRGVPDAGPGPRTHHLGVDDVDALVALRRRHPDLVLLVDDAEGLSGTPMEHVVTEVLRLVDRDQGLVAVSALTSAVSSQFRGPLADVAGRRTGVLLCPSGLGDGEVFGIRPPLGLVHRPGHGILVSGGRCTEVQVALPSSP